MQGASAAICKCRLERYARVVVKRAVTVVAGSQTWCFPTFGMSAHNVGHGQSHCICSKDDISGFRRQLCKNSHYTFRSRIAV